MNCKIKYVLLVFALIIFTVDGASVKDLQGERSESIIRRKIDAVEKSLAEIYKKRLEEKPSLSGKIHVSFSILESGKVENATITTTMLNDSLLEDALLDSLTKVDFRRYNIVSGTTDVVGIFSFEPFDVSEAKKIIFRILGVICIGSSIIHMVIRGAIKS